MKAMLFTKTSDLIRATRLDIPEDSNLDELRKTAFRNFKIVMRISTNSHTVPYEITTVRIGYHKFYARIFGFQIIHCSFRLEMWRDKRRMQITFLKGCVLREVYLMYTFF